MRSNYTAPIPFVRQKFATFPHSCYIFVTTHVVLHFCYNARRATFLLHSCYIFYHTTHPVYPKDIFSTSARMAQLTARSADLSSVEESGSRNGLRPESCWLRNAALMCGRLYVWPAAVKTGSRNKQ